MSNTAKRIAVIGAGIMGLCAVRELSRSGHEVVLYEKNHLPARNASYMAGGMLAPYSEIEHMPRDWIEAGLEGIRIWERITHDLGRAAQTEFERAGSLLVAHDEDRYILERFQNHLTDSAVFEHVDTTKIMQLEPQIAERFSGGLLLKEEAHLHPQKTIEAMLKDMDFEQRHEIADPKQLQQEYDYVIDCRGYGAEKEDYALRGVKGELVIVRNKEFYLRRPVRLMHPRYPLYVVPRKGNIFMIGATMIETANSEFVSVRSSLELLSALYSLHPTFGDAQIVDIAAGLRPAYSNNLPRIRVKGNVLGCNGLFRHGFLLAPIMAECVEHMINGKDHKYTTLFTGAPDEGDNQRPRTDLRSAA
ncbi:MAG: FAD-dependent oxidoreductase [Alphaproteobacteria bacterium]|nr:FAD-dependent oxidoreductase [Alphaproteobacteria bacterium]